MTTTTERIFFIGGTGNVGTKTAQDLLAMDIPITFYSRNPAKITNLFSNNPNVKAIQGDLSDISPLKEALKGHTRLFLLYTSFADFAAKKTAIAKLAYEAGIKQIVDISSQDASSPWRTTYIGIIHMDAERAILDIAQRGSFVALRPGRFMSNILNFDHPSPEGLIFDTSDQGTPQGWISPNDIGAVAAVVLSQDISKHGDSVYELIGDAVTPTERASALSQALGRPIKYEKINAITKYDNLMKTGIFPHSAAFHIATVTPSATISVGISVLLGRDPQTLKEFITLNKSYFD